MRRHIIMIGAATIIILGLGIWPGFADQYTGGAGDGWSSSQSSDFAVTGPDITFSSSRNQVFRVGQVYYPPSGYFISQVLDTGGNLDLSVLNWTADVPPGTGLKFQLAGSDTGLEGSWTEFLGTDGTTSTFFTSIGEAIPAALDTKRYIKYRVYFSTVDSIYTPSFSDIKFTFTSDVEADRLISDISDNPFTVAVKLNMIAPVFDDPGEGTVDTDTPIIIRVEDFNDVLIGAATEPVTVTVTSDSGNAYISSIDTGTDGSTGVGVTSTVITSVGGIIEIKIHDEIGDGTNGTLGDPENVTVTATHETFTSEVSSQPFIIEPGKTVKYTLTQPADIDAGTEALYNLKRYDQYDNLVYSDYFDSGTGNGSEIVTLTSTSTGAEKQFRPISGVGVTPGDSTRTIADGVDNADIYYYDELSGTWTVTASRANVATDGADTISIMNTAADHLVISTDVANPVEIDTIPEQKAGVEFTLPGLIVVDAYENVANGTFGGPVFSGNLAVSYTLGTGLVNGPDWVQEGDDFKDMWTESVDFTNAASTTTLDTILYRAQETTIRADSVSLTGTGTESNLVTIIPETASELRFDVEPAATDPPAVINVPLDIQPKVTTHDYYGNYSDDIPDDNSNPDPDDQKYIKIYATSTPSGYSTPLGTLIAPDSPGEIINNEVQFSGVTYNTPLTPEVIYLYAVAGYDNGTSWVTGRMITAANSQAITFGVADTTIVEAADIPVADFDITPTNDDSDTAANRFEVLKFKITDAGGDGQGTLIDQLTVNMTHTGSAVPAIDIAWAALWVDGAEITSVAAIVADSITFGFVPDGEGDADLYAVPDNTAKEFTLYICMNDEKLYAVENDRFTFDINEDDIGVDTGLSSQMVQAANSNVAQVVGTVDVVMTHLEVVEQTGSQTDSVAVISDAMAGVTREISVRSTDANRNIDINYTGVHSLVFFGLADSPDGYKPNMEGTTQFGAITATGFITGVSQTDVLTMMPYAREIADLSVLEQNQTSYLVHTLNIDVDSNIGDSVAITSGQGQPGIVSAEVTLPMTVTIKDQYGNLGVLDQVNFAIATDPSGGGASLSEEDGLSDTNGEVTTYLTFGATAGLHEVTATTVTPMDGSPLTFTETALMPGSLTLISENNPSGRKVTQTLAPITVEFLTAAPESLPVNNVVINFEINSSPPGTQGMSLSASQDTTDALGQASTVLTLGDKRGEYSVRAITGSFFADFTVIAGPDAPHHFVITGPDSVKAGEVSSAFQIETRDQYDNMSEVALETVFDLTNAPSATGTFFEDSEGLITNNQAAILLNTGSIEFYYKDTLVQSPITMKAARNSGQVGLFDTDDEKAISVIPGNMHHFRVTGSTAVLNAGDSRGIMVIAYDVENNVNTDFTASNMAVTFSGPNTSPAPSNAVPTCSDKDGVDVAFGSPVTLTFTGGAVTTTFKPYKADNVVIKATSGPILTADADDLEISVIHLAADHLKFKTSLPSPQIAGEEFDFGTTLDAVDTYDNVCNGLNGAPIYNTSIQVTWILSGISNAPGGTPTDKFVSPVTFTNGSSSTPLNATLFYAQDTTITADVVGLGDTSIGQDANVASNSITVDPHDVAKLEFVQQPSQDCVTTRPLTEQPKVAVADQYGNPVTNSTATITLTPVLPITFQPATNGTLIPEIPSQLAVNGIATFSGISYTYPESILLQASTSTYAVAPEPSSQIDFTLDGGANGSTVLPGPLQEPSLISSLSNSALTKTDVLDFIVTDMGMDGYGTAMKQVIVKRDTVNDTTGGWLDYIDGAYITDGPTTLLGIVQDDQILWGSGANVVLSNADGETKIYTVSVFLKPVLPVGADNEVAAFSVDADVNITQSTLSSKFAVTDPISSTPYIDVAFTNFMVEGDSVMNAGESNSLTITAIDVIRNKDEDYFGDIGVAFSGASVSSAGTEPTCTNYIGSDVEFWDNTDVSFSGGVNTSAVNMKLYAAESALIKVKVFTDIDFSKTANDDALSVIVSGGVPDKLLWDTPPVDRIVANAQWVEYSVKVTDSFGNTATASSNDVSITVTNINPGNPVTLSTDAVDVVPAASGIATFRNYAVEAVSYPCYITIRAESAGVAATEQSGVIRIDENYNVKLIVLDYTTGAPASEVKVIVHDADGVLDPRFPVTGNSPFTFTLPAGELTMTLEKSKYLQELVPKTAGHLADYFDGSYDSEIEWEVTITSLAEATADYSVKNAIVYEEDADKLTMRAWLERRGKLIKGDDGINNLGETTVRIYNDAGTVWFDDITLTNPTDGLYFLEVTDVISSGGVFPNASVGTNGNLTLEAGKTYFAKILIGYGGDLGDARIYEGGDTFNIATSKILRDIAEEIKYEVAGVQTTVIEQATEVKETVVEETDKVEVVAEAIKQATGTASLPDQITAVKTQVVNEVVPHIKSEILTRVSSVKVNAKVAISYRTSSGLAPTMTVYGPKNVAVIEGVTMLEGTVNPVNGTSVYSSQVEFKASYGTGEFTIVCSEASKNTMDAIIITVYSTDIVDVAGNVAAILGTTSGIDEFGLIATRMASQLAYLEAAINRIGSRSEGSTGSGGSGADSKLAGVEATTSSFLKTVHQSLGKLSAQIQDVGATSGLGMEKLFEVSQDKEGDVAYIKNKTQELKAMMELNQKMIDNVANEPVVQTWYEYGSVILKIIIVNPSETQERDVPFKAYLPKEAKPEHVLSKGELKVAYDTQQGSYYVFATFKMAPKEFKEVEIEMKDIWVIKSDDIITLREETKKVSSLLENTEFSDRARYLVTGIEEKLLRIEERQEIKPANPEDHISRYRENLRLMLEAKQDLALLRTLLSRVKAVPMKMTWKLIVAIVAFLGILSLGFYLVWQKQMKLFEVPTFVPENELDKDKGKKSEVRGKKSEDKKDKKKG